MKYIRLYEEFNLVQPEDIDTKNLTSKEYCKKVDLQERELQKQLPTVNVKDINSPLISLKYSGFNLVFEPSSQENYQYLVREEIYNKIGRISKILDKQNKRLIIRSVFRSFEHQQLLWDEEIDSLKEDYPNKSIEEIEEICEKFYAPPTKTPHATGGAVDVLIYDLKTNIVMDFGANDDHLTKDGIDIDLNEKCYPYNPTISEEAKKNRKLLFNLFEDEDFVVDMKEYWHFDYGNVFWALRKGKDAFYDIIEDE